MLLIVSTALADTSTAVSYAGRQLVSVIEEFRMAGVDFAYSTNVVTSDLDVAFEPQPGTPLEIMQQILTPLGLAVRSEAGTYIIVRNDTVEQGPAAAPAMKPGRPVLI